MAVDKTKDIQVGGTLHSIATGNIIAHADEVMDEDYGKKQSVINQELSNRLTEELKGYLPLSGGTLTGDLVLNENLLVNKGLSVNDGGALFTAPVRVFSGNNSRLLVTGNTGGLGTPGVTLKGTGQIQVGYVDEESGNLSINKDGITIPNKTATDLLNAAGGTTAIANLASNYVTLDTDQNVTGTKTFNKCINSFVDITTAAPNDVQIGASMFSIAKSAYSINMASSDIGTIWAGGSSDNGFLVLTSGDNGTEPIYAAQTEDGSAYNIAHLITLMDTTGNQKFNQVTATGYTIEGKTASDLLTANGSTTVLKTIGGESLLGTENIEVTTDEDIEALFI